MINLIYLCFNANSEEKEEIYKVLISSEEITNFCQESVKSELSLELNEKLKGDYLFNDIDNFYFSYYRISNWIMDKQIT